MSNIQSNAENLKTRILKRSTKNPKTGCQTWQGAKDINGFGRIHTPEGVRSVHRVMWLIERGEIEVGMLVYHECGNRACVNVEHMFLAPLQVESGRDTPARTAQPRTRVGSRLAGEPVAATGAPQGPARRLGASPLLDIETVFTYPKHMKKKIEERLGEEIE